MCSSCSFHSFQLGVNCISWQYMNVARTILDFRNRVEQLVEWHNIMNLCNMLLTHLTWQPPPPPISSPFISSKTRKVLSHPQTKWFINVLSFLKMIETNIQFYLIWLVCLFARMHSILLGMVAANAERIRPHIHRDSVHVEDYSVKFRFAWNVRDRSARFECQACRNSFIPTGPQTVFNN